MSARHLATGCSLALMAVLLGPSASAAPRSPSALKSATRRPSSPPIRPAIRAAAPAPAPAPPAPPAPVPAPPLAPVSAPAAAPPISLAGALDASPRDQANADESPLRTRFAVTLNPLPLIIGRYGANGEVLLASHHAIVASAYVQTFSRQMIRALLPSVDLGEAPASRLGGELGYRFYTGRDGPTGLFIGPSAVAMPIAYPRVTEDLRAEVVSFNAYGGALDVGVQAVIGPGFTIGGGVGVMALAYTPPASIAPPPGIQVPSYPEPHVLPRLLMMAGWAF
jgi:hypothetical protein